MVHVVASWTELFLRRNPEVFEMCMFLTETGVARHLTVQRVKRLNSGHSVPVSRAYLKIANECRIDEAFFFIESTSVAKLVGNIRQHPPQDLIAAPSLEAPMYGFIVRKALWQHVPLRTRVENPQDRLVGIGFRSGRPSGMCSFGKCFRIRSYCSSVSRIIRHL
jgi:hypothetical protein